MARPTKYDPKLLPQIKKYAAAGLIDEQLAVVLGVHVDTIYEWKDKHPEFSEAIKEGKTLPNGKVVRSLYELACGYSLPEDKIFCNPKGEITVVPTIKHYPPNATAGIYWTKNRMPDDWKDKQEHDMNLKSWPDSIKVTIVNGD